MIAPQSTPRLRDSENPTSQTGSVSLAGSVITTSARVNSFQAWMNAEQAGGDQAGREQREG